MLYGHFSQKAAADFCRDIKETNKCSTSSKFILCKFCKVLYCRKEGGNFGTLLGPIEVAAVCWRGVITKHWCLFCGRLQLKNWRQFPNIVFRDLFTHYSWRVSNGVQSEQVKITGINFTTDTSQLPRVTKNQWINKERYVLLIPDT